jgi:hypothetical protein
MRPIPIPPATIVAHGGAYVSVSAPIDFEFTDGTKPEPFEGMRIGDVVYSLIGIEDGEIEALKRTKCFYLGFFSGHIPIFTLRVADVAFGEPDVEEVLPVISDNYDLHQEARDSWPTMMDGNVAYKQIDKRSRFVQIVGKDERHQDIFMSTVVEASSYILHSFRLGETIIVPQEWLDFLYGSTEHRPTEIPQVEIKEVYNSGEEQEPVPTKNPTL